ncbi:MAG: aminopeptidase [Myxococcota bacterium]
MLKSLARFWAHMLTLCAIERQGKLWMAVMVMLMLSGCYVVRSSYYQMELLAYRESTADVKARCSLAPWQAQALATVADVKRFGREIGLAGSANYDTIATGWQRPIWNVSGCDPLAFKPKTWWFPFVGTVPYLGFFTDEDADAQIAQLREEGLDVYKRPVGAYSTLGWFEDPILLHMLEWSTFDLANIILHELTHATVWIQGSVAFNESFANFVGDTAAFRYLESRYGTQSAIYRQAQETAEDRDRWRKVLLDLYHALETLYASDLPPQTKLKRKAALFESLPERVRAGGFHRPEAYVRVVQARAPWGNAHVVQFRTYNANRAWFEAVLEQHNGDLLAFMQAIKRLAEEGDGDPYKALERAATQ